MVTAKSENFERTFKGADGKGVWVGVYMVGKDVIEKFWRLECPCGEVVFYPLNELPLEDTPMPCDDPNHWAVKVEKE